MACYGVVYPGRLNNLPSEEEEEETAAPEGTSDDDMVSGTWLCIFLMTHKNRHLLFLETSRTTQNRFRRRKKN